ncbi:MAG TPA: TolC family protein [Thermoanaerobaculia bacterium]
MRHPRRLLVPCLWLAGALPLAGQAPTPAATPPAAVVRLSLAEAYRLAATNNLGARIARDQRDIAAFDVEIERGVFDWNVWANAGAGRIQAEDANPRSSGLGTIFFADISVDQSTRAAGAGTSKLFGWGGSLSASFSPSWTSIGVQQQNHLFGSDEIVATSFSTLNPYGGHLSLAYDQPLLRGRGSVAAEARLKAAEERADEAEIVYQLSLIQLLTTTDNLYWDHVFALQNLLNKREALLAAQKQLSEDSERVKSGMLAPLELPQVEASVADRETQVYSAEAAVDNTRAALLTFLYADRPRPAGAEIADQPALVPFGETVDDAERDAMARRPELKLAAGQVAERLIEERFAQNRVLPQLDAIATYTGLARSQPGAGAALSDLLTARLPGYFVGLTLSLPLGNRAARGAFEQSRVAREEAELSVVNIRENVRLEVQQAYTALRASEKQVGAAQKAVDFHVQSLQAETDKLESGYSTSFFVLQRQDELAQARTALIQAQVDYRRALTGFERATGVLLDRRLPGQAM